MEVVTLGSLCKQFAEKVLFGRASLKDASAMGLQLRKGRTLVDASDAIRHGLNQGMGKTETEIDMVALYLRDVFKLQRNANETAKPLHDTDDK